jgi:hypothetical protein
MGQKVLGRQVAWTMVGMMEPFGPFECWGFVPTSSETEMAFVAFWFAWAAFQDQAGLWLKS